nr:aryl hydrocarbon receptor-like isoform X2 [Monopterus albus]
MLQKNARSAPLVTANGRNGQSVSLDGVSFSEGEFLLQALNGFVLVVTTDGTIFYSSPMIQDFLGFHQSDVMHRSVYELIHMDDRETFRCQLHFALNPSESESDVKAGDGPSSSKASSSSQNMLPLYIPPEISSFPERSFCCRFRCLLDHNSGFLTLNFNGRLKFLDLQGNARPDGNVAPPQLALFAVATPLHPLLVTEIHTETLLFQTKHRMDFAPVGIDTRGRLVLGYTVRDLVTIGSGYRFIHAADMMHCADSHLRMIKTGESGFTFFRLLTKTGQWQWVQASARIIFKAGRPDFVISFQKALTNEEGEEHLHQRRQQLPFNLATGEGVLYDISLDPFSIPGPPGPSALGAAEPTTDKPLNPASLLGSLLQQDHSLYTQPQKPSPRLPVCSQIEDPDLEQPQPSLEQAFLDSHALLTGPGQIQTSQKTSITRDLTSEAMIDSLKQILGDIRGGGIEGLEVEETELRNWENTLVGMTREREDTSRELNQILASDVFSYVEEALRRETGGYVHGSDQTGPHVSATFSSLSIQEQHPVFSNEELQQQPQTDVQSNRSVEQTQPGNVLGDWTELNGASHRAAHMPKPAQCPDTHQDSSSHQCANQIISTQSCLTHHCWLPSVQVTGSIHSSQQSGLELKGQSVQDMLNHAGSQQMCTGPRLQGPSVCKRQQQQMSQSFHHHSVAHSPQTPGSVNSSAWLFHTQTQGLSDSCMYDKREGPILSPAAVPSSQTGPLLGSTCSRGHTHATGTTRNAPPFTPSHPDTAFSVISRGMMPSAVSSTHMAACTDISFGHVSGDSCGLGAAQSDYPPENYHYSRHSSAGTVKLGSTLCP